MKPLETLTHEELIDLALQLQTKVAEFEARHVSKLHPSPYIQNTPSNDYVPSCSDNIGIVSASSIQPNFVQIYMNWPRSNTKMGGE